MAAARAAWQAAGHWEELLPLCALQADLVALRSLTAQVRAWSPAYALLHKRSPGSQGCLAGIYQREELLLLCALQADLVALRSLTAIPCPCHCVPCSAAAGEVSQVVSARRLPAACRHHWKPRRWEKRCWRQQSRTSAEQQLWAHMRCQGSGVSHHKATCSLSSLAA